MYPAPMTTPLLRARSLALPPRLRDFSLELNAGQAVGLLGTNGAGKSTALAVLAGALAYETGELHHQKTQIGWLPQHSPLYPDMRVFEQLRFAEGLYQIKDANTIDGAITRFDLAPLARRLCGQLSGGEQRRVALACATLHQPRVLLLDEPSSGLDAEQAEAMRHYIRQLMDDRAVLIASHQSEDIQGLCQSVCLMVDGRLLATPTLHALDRYRLARFTHTPPTQALCDIAGVQKVLGHDRHGVLIQLSEDAPASMPEKIACRGWGLQSWEQAPIALLAKIHGGTQ